MIRIVFVSRGCRQVLRTRFLACITCSGRKRAETARRRGRAGTEGSCASTAGTCVDICQCVKQGIHFFFYCKEINLISIFNNNILQLLHHAILFQTKYSLRQYNEYYTIHIHFNKLSYISINIQIIDKLHLEVSLEV